MLAYSALFGSALSGYAGLGLWAAALVAAVLVAVSQIQYGGIYKRAAETGYLDMAQSTLLQSFGNAIVASGVCYAGGWLFRLL